MALLADGHLLVEGAPGLAKTRAVKSLADGLEAGFHRIQFTPDLLPADVTGTEIYSPEDGNFRFQPGPVFQNLVLADEINRSPAKVQSALLEAMAERQVSIGSKTWPLPEIFMVLATQNPIEQEGTYPLPEAQLDRFLMHVKVQYPDVAAEKKILRLARGEAMKQTTETPVSPLTQANVLAARQEVLGIHIEPIVEEYIVQFVHATRTPSLYDSRLGKYLDIGASPRGTIALERCARARAWLRGKDFVAPDDVQSVAHDVLRHRLLLSFEAEAAGRSVDDIIDQLLSLVPVA
jgi:MoxR-like ATPase